MVWGLPINDIEVTQIINPKGDCTCSIVIPKTKTEMHFYYDILHSGNYKLKL